MTSRTDALDALADRGIDSPEQLIDCGTPDQIIAACHRWDHRDGVTVGLLVHWIRDGNFPDPEPPTPSDRLRAQFAEHQARLPVGTPIGHCLDPQCIGIVRVEESSYPILILECSVCRQVDGIPIRDLHRIRPYRDPDIAF